MLQHSSHGMHGLVLCKTSRQHYGVSPLQAAQLTPAQQAMKRRDRQGNPFEFFQMIISLVKRW
jgi:hypothetical protein